jgi:gas vesicle protein
MLGNAKTAVKYFVYGLIVGLAVAPRSGAETRKEVINWATEAIRSVLSGSSSKEV